MVEEYKQTLPYSIIILGLGSGLNIGESELIVEYINDVVGPFTVGKFYNKR